MYKWSFLAAAAAWVLSMQYEWLWNGGRIVQYLAWAVVGATVLLGLMVRSVSKEDSGRKPRPMEWFLLAALTAALFFAAVEHTAQGHLTHIPVLPMYIVLFLDFFLTGGYLWWQRLKRRK